MKKIILLACLFCIGTAVFAQPANDLCANATPLAVDGTGTCINSLATNVDATDSGELAPGCASYSGGDVWFTVTVPASGEITVDTDNAGGFTDSGMAIYSGTCGAFTLIECDDDDSDNGTFSLIELTGQTVGATLYIRVWEFGNNAFGDFNICAFSPPPPPPAPANDDCINATSLTVGATCSATAGTVESATDSGESTTCTGTEDDDVWYSFVATDATQIVQVGNLAGSTTDVAMGVFSGSCGALVNEGCTDTNTGFSVSGLTVGQTYYVQFYTWSATAGQTTTFDICIKEPPPPATNDDCPVATVLTVGPAGSSCTPTAGNLGGATDSGEDCGVGTADDDIWYSFVAADATQNIEVTGIAGSTTDIAIGVYSGTCGALVNEACTDANVGLALTGLTVGQTYYINVYTWTGTTGQTTTFDICVKTLPPPPSALCAEPTALCAAEDTEYSANTEGTAEAGNDYGCLITQPRPSWFYLEVDMAGDFVLNINNTVDLDYALWGPFADLAAAQGACGALAAPLDCSFSATTSPEVATVTGAMAGEVYVLLVTAYSATPTTFTLTQANGGDAGAGTTDCSIVPIELLDLTGTAKDKVNTIAWKTASEQNTQWHVVERSINGQDKWLEIGREKAADESLQTLSYQLDDAAPLSAAYYRLRTIDWDGSEEISHTIYIARDSKDFEIAQIAPVPTKDFVTVDYISTRDSDVSIRVTDMLGKVVLERNLLAEKGPNQVRLDLQNISNGFYVVTFDNGTTRAISRIVKQ